MDRSPGSDRMDWEESSSLHIIQPASSPWRKRSFDTYNDTNEPYRPDEAYSPYQVTDTLRNQTELVAPFIDANGQPAQYVTDSNGNIILQPITQREPPKPIGYYLPELVKWIIYGFALLIFTSCELAGHAYVHTATVAVRVGDSAKRRLVEVTQQTFAPAPPPRRQGHNTPPHRRSSPIIRRVSPTLPGGRTHIPVTPPRARPKATHEEAAVTNHDCIVDYVPSKPEDDHLMSGVILQPYSEPLMSGALEDMDMDMVMDEEAPNLTSSSSRYHIPGSFPDSPAPPGFASTELSAPGSQAGDEMNIPHNQPADKLSIPHDQPTDELVTSDEQIADELATSRSEASDESEIPDVQPSIKLPLEKIDSRPRNYKGELLDEWQINVCREFQAIHSPLRKSRRQTTNFSEHPQDPDSTGSNTSYRHLLTNECPTAATGLIDSRHSPVANVSPPQPHGMKTIGSNDLHRSPLDLHRAISDVVQRPHEISSIGLNDSHRSPLAYVSPMREGDVLPHDAITGESHSPPKTITTGSIDSSRSPLANVSPINSPHGTSSIGSIDSPRSPLANVSPINSPHEMSPIGSIDSSRSPLADSRMRSAIDLITETLEAGAEISDCTLGATPVTSRSPPTNLSATMSTTPTESRSNWFIRSFYARVKGKPKTRSPLCERINNANINKVPKTPKKVTWPEHGPVTATKRFMKNEAMSHPSPSSSREDSSILSSVPSDLSPQSSPPRQEEEAEQSPSHQLRLPTQPTSANDNWGMSPISTKKSETINPTSTAEHTDAVHNSGDEETIDSSSSSDSEASVQSIETPKKTPTVDPSTPPSLLSPNFEGLTISTRRSSLRRREKEDQAQKLRDAIAAEEKARKDKEEAEEKARKEKEEAEEKARIKAEEEEERKKTGDRRIPIERVIQSLPAGWDEKVRINMAKGMREQLALTSIGNPLTRRDFGMVLPQPGTGDDPSGWLNDEIISGYLQAVVDHGHRNLGHLRGAKPRMHAFTPFFYTTLKERGYEGVKRWSSRAKIGGNDLKNIEYVFIPCNPSKAHWTLVAVSPKRKTIEVFDSMHGSSVDKVNTTKLWLRGELGHSYVDSEWTVVEDPERRGRGKGPTQNNINDCGVFTVTTAKMIVLGVDPMAVSAGDMPLQRRRLVAELLNGGFSGDFAPRLVFE